MAKHIKKPTDSFLKHLTEATGAIITPHDNPDGDAVGSSLSLSLFLKGLGIPSIILTSNEALFRREMSKINKASALDNSLIPSDFDIREHIRTAEKLGSFPLHIYVDCSEEKRISYRLDEINKAKILKDPYLQTVAIDHHQGDKNFKHSYIEKDSPSTGELVFRLIKKHKSGFTPYMAAALFFSISADTGFFRHLGTEDEATYQIAGELVDLGANPALTYSEMFGGKSLGSIEYMSIILGSIRSIKNNKVLVAMDDKNAYKKYSKMLRPSNTIYDLLLSVANVELVAFLKYTDTKGLFEGSLRVSPRSNINAHLLANKIANGGGHIKAAGFTINKESLEDVYQELIKTIEAEEI